ncbi:MAG: hypothetical protein AB2L24_06710 [Mangrovibacterium sp.]
MEHDRNGYTTGRFKDPDSGLGYNMGLLRSLSFVLYSGTGKILLEKVFSEKHMWTPAGICVIDQAAPYYRIDGYWNGTVWMPPQWFMWKACSTWGVPTWLLNLPKKRWIFVKGKLLLRIIPLNISFLKQAAVQDGISSPGFRPRYC